MQNNGHIAEEGIIQINDLINKSFEIGRNNPVQGIALAQEAIQLSNGDQKIISRALACKGSSQVWIGDYDTALQNLFDALAGLKEPEENRFEAHAYYHIFCAFYFLADYDNALKYGYEMLQRAEATANNNARANALNGIGTIFYTTGQNDKALEVLHQGFEIATELEDKNLLARILDGLGSSYFNLGNIQKSIEYKKKSLETARTWQLKNVESYAIDGLAKLYVASNDFENAEKCFVESLSIREGLNFKAGIADTHLQLGELYFTRKDYEKSLPNLLDALEISSEINTKEVIFKAHLALSKYYEDQKDIEKFTYHLKSYYQYKDEFFSEKQKQKMKGAEMQFRISQMENEKELLSRKNAELQTLSNDLALLGDIGKNITALLSVEEINKTVYDLIHSIMDAPSFGIGVYNAKDNTIEFPGYLEDGELLSGGHYDVDDEDRFASICFKNDIEVIINDIDAEYSKYVKSHLEPTAGKSSNSLIYLPLKTKDKKIGVITVQSYSKHSYTERHVNVLRNIANYAAIALDNATLYETLEDRIAERTKEVTAQKEQIEKSQKNTRLLSEIGQQIISSTNFDNIFGKLHHNVSKLMKAECFGVRIYYPERNEIEYRYELERGELHPPLSVPMTNEDNFSVWCVKNKKEIFINDNLNEYQKYTKKIVVPSGDMPHSLLFCPMMIGDKVMGVITVQSFEKHAYEPLHMDILKTLGTYTAIALENANLVENLEVKVRERTQEVVKQKEQIEKTFNNTKLLSEIGKEITSTLSVDEIISKVYERVNTLMDAVAFGIGLYRPDTNDLFHTGVMEKGNMLPDFSFSLDEERVSTICFKQNREIIINNWEEEHRQYINKDIDTVVGESPVSMIYMPLSSKGKTIGVMSVQSFNANAYNSYHLDIIRSLALYIGSAIENASLYEGMEERVKERTQEIEKAYQNTKLLSQISKEISSSLSIETIISNVYKSVNELMDAECFGIGIYNEETRTLRLPGFMEKGMRYDDVFYSIDDDRLATYCLRNKCEIFINNFPEEYKNYIKGIQAPKAGKDASSIIYLPLYLKEKVMGVITVQSFKSNVYTQYHLDILRNMAQSVASAIENARLYESMEEEVKERTREVVKQKEQIEKTFANTKLISEIGKEISATLSVDEIISKVYERINAIMDATTFGIGLYRPAYNDLHFVGAMEKGRRLGSFSYFIEDERIATMCFNQSSEIIINDWSAEHTRYVAADYDATEGEMPEAMIYVPLISKGKTLGVMTVQSFDKHAYNDYHANVIRSLSVYVGSAIENANLYQGLEERVRERTAEIEQAYQNTKLLSQISKEISSSLSIETIISKVYENVNRLMDAASFGIGILNPKNGQIVFPGFIEKGERLDNVVFHIDDDRLACWSFKNQREIFTNDYPSEYRKFVSSIQAPVAGKSSSSIIYIPIYSKEKIIGVLTVQSYKLNAYSDYHLDILRNLSHSIGIAIDNATLYTNLEEKVQERTAEVVKQKEIIIEKNKHITDSIKYAKRIQEAIIPGEETVTSHLKNAFVLYKPKDIVSGDFYWIERKGNKILFAVVDCTGHGVPGAFMSIIGFNGLNQIVNEYNITRPAEILNRLNNIISTTLKQRVEDSKIRDGMDVAICCIDMDHNKLEFAGAFNPLFIIRNNQVLEFKGDKQPIGNFIGDEVIDFTNQEIELLPNDKIYLFSDGYADQFGGPHGKKLKYNTFKDLLLNNHTKPMQAQKQELNNSFEAWRGDFEQIDDVCIIGVSL